MTLLERDERMWEQGYQEGFNEGFNKSFNESFNESFNKSFNESIKIGENLFASLIIKLIEDGRREDIERAANDEEYRYSLYVEYHLK